MPANRRRNNPLKNSSDIFSEEYQTAAEKLLDSFATSANIITQEDLHDLPKLTQEICQANPELTPQEAETEILDLLDKFYNGDRDVPAELRYSNKDIYKHQLINKFKQWGLVYIEKKHYALSRPEKHLIRMDFYGTVNKPRRDQTSDAYRKNESIFQNSPKKKISKINTAPQPSQQYNLEDYHLEASPAWHLMRTFPRFHTLENKIRMQMQRQGVNPEVIPFLNIYDYSDLLYNYFKQKNGKDDDCVTIFLGARQSFVKDVFLKNEAWLRRYFQRRNYNERYIEALIKSARSRGITGNIELKNTTKDFIVDYIRKNRHKFSDYLRQQVQDGNHVQNILEQLENTKQPLNNEMRSFIILNKDSFKSYFKHKHITSRQIHAIFELLSETDMPFYMKDTLRTFTLQNEQPYQAFLLQEGYSEKEALTLIKRLKNRNGNEQDNKQIIAFARKNISLLRDNLSKENRDENYIRLAENCLTPPPIPEYIRENLYNFMMNGNPARENTELFEKLRQDGNITPDNYDAVRQYVLKHRKEYSEYYKRNNIFTYQELNEQHTDITNFLIKTRNIPNYAQNFSKDFILQNQDIFRYWYANFQQQKYQSIATKQYENIQKNGLAAKDNASISQFILQRLDVFSGFCEKNNLNLPKEEIGKIFQYGNIFKNQSETEKELKKQTEQFILQNSYAYRRMLIQQQISQKEKEADLILQKLAKQGITQNLASIAHKFVLNNKHLFSNNLFNSGEDNNYAKGILDSLTKESAQQETQNQAKSFISQHQTAFENHIRSEENIKKYIQNTLARIDEDSPSAETSYWSLKFISQNTESFEQYLTEEKIGDDNIRLFMNKINTEKLAENLKISFGKNGIALQFNDGTSIAFPKLSVHHKCAVQDSFEQITIQNFKQTANTPQLTTSYNYPNLAAANYFNNLCLIIDDPYHIRFFHGMDSTEKFDNCERYIARLYPADTNVIFFGSLAPEDKLSYDYSHDPRTLRYRKHTEKMIEANKEANKKYPVPSDTSFYVITGSRQGRR